jgi:predicted hydrolase (HD superfamily)
MEAGVTREEALALLKKYNHKPFHLSHALTVEAIMRWFVRLFDYAQKDIDFWGLAGLLHDVDFECFPEQHCVKSAELLEKANASKDLIHAVCCHGYKICCDVEPMHQMEKVLYAVDELSGLIGAAARLRPSKSCCDMDVSSLRKKFKDKAFASGCSRDVILQGAQMLDWELNELFDKTIQAMRSCEDIVNTELSALFKLQMMP